MSRPPRPKPSGRSIPPAPPRDERIATGYRGGLVVATPLRFRWMDRLRILCGRRVIVRTLTFTEHKPGRLKTGETLVSVEGIFRGKHPVDPAFQAPGTPRGETSA